MAKITFNTGKSQEEFEGNTEDWLRHTGITRSSYELTNRSALYATIAVAFKSDVCHGPRETSVRVN